MNYTTEFFVNQGRIGGKIGGKIITRKRFKGMSKKQISDYMKKVRAGKKK